MKMNKFAQEVHENAVNHGWWEEPRSFGEIIALCHSELSEALEEFRAKRPMLYAEGEKPKGIAVELADCIIRVMDWLGKEEFDVDELLLEARTAVMCDVPCRIYNATLGDSIARWHLLLSLAYSCWCRESGTHASALRMARCVCEISEWSAAEGVDLETVLHIKHDYNKTRPYRHGGKVL